MKIFELRTTWSRHVGSVELVLRILKNDETSFAVQHTKDNITEIYNFDTYKEANKKYDELSKGVFNGTTN